MLKNSLLKALGRGISTPGSSGKCGVRASRRNLMDNPFNGAEKLAITTQGNLLVTGFEAQWRRLLACICREAVVSDNPFRPDDERTGYSGFTGHRFAAGAGDPVQRPDPRRTAGRMQSAGGDGRSEIRIRS